MRKASRKFEQTEILNFIGKGIAEKDYNKNYVINFTMEVKKKYDKMRIIKIKRQIIDEQGV